MRAFLCSMVVLNVVLATSMAHAQLAPINSAQTRIRELDQRANLQEGDKSSQRFIVPVSPSDSPTSQSLSITGNYSGTTTQPANTFGVPVFQSQFSLTEDSSGNVTGTRYDGIYGTPYFAIWSVSGTISTGIFTFLDQALISQNPEPGTLWCQISGTLTVSPDGNTLTGPWTSSNCGSSGYGTVNVSRSSGKLVGSGSLATGDCQCGDPIDINTGNVHEQFIDYSTRGSNLLQFIRYYNSRAQGTYSTEIGTNWRSNFDRYLQLFSSEVVAERANGQQLIFTLQSGTWVSDSDVDVTLSESGSTWTLTDGDDTVETYNAINGIEATLTTIESRNGYEQTLTYNSSGLLMAVTDSYGRSLSFAYNGSDMLQTVTTPDSSAINYAYASTTGGPNLTSATYSDGSAVSYSYTFAQLPNVLTGIRDEDGNNYATWTYDIYGRGLTSQHGNGADLVTVVYDDSTSSTTVTNAFGVTDTYTFTTLEGVPKVAQISRAATSTTAAASEEFTYDTNGYLANKNDWNGNQTTYVNNNHGLPTTINEAVGTSAARTKAITYDSTWVHLPATIVSPGLTTSFAYDGYGEVLTKTLTDTTSTTTPYSTSGQARTWTNAWSNSLLASVKTPNGNITRFGYDGSGALTSVTDAKGHVTNIASHTGGGLPEVIVDPNGVTTTLTYSPRLWPLSSLVSGSVGAYTTSWSYDSAGNLLRTTLPDGSYIANIHDSAHRLIQITDSLGSSMSYTLDALGDRTMTTITAKGGTSAVWQDTKTFDALGRLLVDAQGAGQTTTRRTTQTGMC